jgi:regulator of sigma E protease
LCYGRIRNKPRSVFVSLEFGAGSIRVPPETENVSLSDTVTGLFSGNSFFLTILAFLFLLTVVVFVHEMGHYLVGRWCGIGVKAFSIGFGPELVGFTAKSGTRWKISAIPLGGYVKFAGDENVTSTPDPTALEAMSEEEKAGAFHLAPVWKRALTVFAGPFANFLLTIAIFSVIFGIYGRSISDPIVTRAIPGSAAEAAGFLPGDVFLRVDGNKIRTFGDVQRHVGPRVGQPIVFVMERQGKEVELTAIPKGTETTDPLGNKVKLGVIGVETDRDTGKFRTETYSPIAALGEGVRESVFIAGQTGEFLGRLVRGREDRCQLGGPVKIAAMAGKAAERGFAWLIQLTALLSIGIGILNLLPIPPLDGGHLLFYGIEAINRRPVTEKLQEIVYRIGAVAVLTFMLFVIFNDLFAC